MMAAYQGSGGFPNKTVQYVGELVFEGTVLKEIRHGSGRVLADAGYKYQYNLADHLGSTRVVLQENPANFTVTLKGARRLEIPIATAYRELLLSRQPWRRNPCSLWTMTTV